MSQSFLRACFLILLGVAAIAVVIELLVHFWVWVMIIAVIVIASYLGLAYLRSRRDRW